MPRVAKQHESRVPMLEQKLARLLDRLDKMGELVQTARDRMDQAEQVVSLSGCANGSRWWKTNCRRETLCRSQYRKKCKSWDTI